MSEYVVRGPGQLQQLAERLLGLSPDKPWRVDVKPHRARRTNAQNALLWAIYTEMAKGTGHTAEEIHEAMKAKFLPPLEITVGDEVIVAPGSSRKLDGAEFSDFIERVQAFAATELGITV